MKFAETSVATQKITLHGLLRNLLDGFQQTAVQHKSFFINDVPDDIFISADEKIVADVLTNLLNLVSRNADNSCIRISAKAYHDVVLMHVKDYNTCNTYALDCGILQVQPLMGKIGGYIDITSQRRKTTTIAFSFSNLPRLAA